MCIIHVGKSSKGLQCFYENAHKLRTNSGDHNYTYIHVPIAENVNADCKSVHDVTTVTPA